MRARGGALAAIAFGTMLGLLGAEIGLRVVARGGTWLAVRLREWDPEAVGVELLGESCVRPRPSSVVRYANGAVAHVNRLRYRGPEVAVPKPPGTRRVVLLGGSTTHGCLLDDDATLDAHLRRLLADTGAPAEVVNLGFDGLDAICDLERLRAEGLAYAPDAVVVHTGVNDVLALRFDHLGPSDPARGFRAERRVAEESRAAARGPWTTLKHWVYLARLPGVLRSVATPGAATVPGPPAPVPAALAGFAATMRAIAASVPATTLVVFSTPPTRAVASGAQPQCGPVVVDAATTARYRDALAATLRDVAAELASRGLRVRHAEHAVLPDELLDECHPTGAGNRRIAADLVPLLAPALRAAAPAELPDGDAAGMRDAR